MRYNFRLLMLIALATLVLGASRVQAQELMIPNFWDKHERFQKTDLSSLPRLRFLTTTDFPPFNFIDRRKRLSGFHVDLVREICRELDIIQRCQIQAVPWEELKPTLERGEAEAIIAGLALTAETRQDLLFTRQYLQIPARFIVRKNSDLDPPAYKSIFRNQTGVVKGSAHKAYFDEVFSNRQQKEFNTRDSALIALREGEVSAVFSDALSLSFWLTSGASKECCKFLDGAFISRKYFGNGLSIAITPNQPDLVEAMNFALARINANGKFAELYLRYFPLGLF